MNEALKDIVDMTDSQAGHQQNKKIIPRPNEDLTIFTHFRYVPLCSF